MLFIPLSKLTVAKVRASLILCIAAPAFAIMATREGIVSIIAGIISTVCFYTLTKITPWK